MKLVIDEACETERARVLAYPLRKKSLDARSLAACIAECRRVARKVMVGKPTRQPRCADPDDQKFLELALAAGADFLVAKDQALLKLARPRKKSGSDPDSLPFRIATPYAFAVALRSIHEQHSGGQT